MVDTVADETMGLPSGSLVFLVKGVLFRVSTAVVLKNCDIVALAAEGLGSGTDNEPIELDVPVQTFRDWLDVLHAPHNSCLNSSHPSFKDLGRLLELLLFCRTYRAMELEAYIFPFIESLAHPNNFASNLINGLTACRVRELAILLDESDIASTARSAILDGLWMNQLEVSSHEENANSTTTIRAQDPYEALLFGERTGDKEIVGAAYYQIMLASPSPWVLDGGLTTRHRLNLQHGMIACAEYWQNLFDSLGLVAVSDDYGYDAIHTPDGDWLHRVWRELAHRKLAIYDVLGKVMEVIRVTRDFDFLAAEVVRMEQEVAVIKSNLATWFAFDDSSASPTISPSNQLTAPSPDVSLLHDDTMRLPSESLEFLVQDIPFRVPKALLQLHSDVFGNMILDSVSEVEPIQLHDSLETFRAWIETIFKPIKLYTNPTHPLRSNLEKVLDMLLFCQKYGILRLEEYLLQIAARLTNHDCLRANLSTSLTAFRLIEIAQILNQPDISAAAQTIIQEDIWSHRSVDLYEALTFGERTQSKGIVGAAYYQLMLSEWSLEARLSAHHRHHLDLGAKTCADVWQDIFNNWCLEQDPATPAKGRRIQYQDCYWLHGVCKKIAKGNFKAHDVIGRLGAASQYASLYCSNDRKATLQAQTENFKANIYTYFVPESPNASGSDIGDNVQV